MEVQEKGGKHYRRDEGKEKSGNVVPEKFSLPKVDAPPATCYLLPK